MCKLGLKNIYKLLLYSLNNGSMITTSLLQNNKDCILTGLVISEYNILTEEEIEDIIDYVDYLEVVPENKYWVNMESFLDNDKNFLKNIYNAYWTINQENILFIIDICKQKNKLITCSSKCKYVHSIYKEYHELYTGKEQPFQHIRLTRELLEYFNFLDEELAYEIVVTNTNKIAEMIEKIDL